MRKILLTIPVPAPVTLNAVVDLTPRLQRPSAAGLTRIEHTKLGGLGVSVQNLPNASFFTTSNHVPRS